MGSLSDFTDIISEVLQITLGLIRGDLTVLSTEGSLEGVFDTSSEWDLTGSLSDITGSLAEGDAISGSLGDGAEG
ncbi:MAG: hypothetical protein ACTH2Y_04830 [Corynebacterium sp.]|uniref:hypothetical protein n=1 Tax=unclassified Corynebacterium TaxID=2624378 RepID=UPI00264853E6|nr:hypothetical protein [Corynebacterium sp.]MDN5719243.1 hypothetical protein [Corynebacterium sp.]MDN6325564.1 hypothetical protein [Corynebacterium sp.]MDN6510654.1 hypothetical protein [Corynebacterium sp.]